MLRGLLGLCCVLCLSVSSYGGQRVYGFDDGTFQDWKYVNLDGDPYPVGDPSLTGVGWKVSNEDIDLGKTAGTFCRELRYMA